MFLYEGSQAYNDAYNARFGDVDSENTIILDKCIVAAEDEIIWGCLPEWFEMESFKNGFKKLYEKFIVAYTDKHYWDEHEKYYA